MATGPWCEGLHKSPSRCKPGPQEESEHLRIGLQWKSLKVPVLRAKLSKAQEDTTLTSTSMLDHLSIHLFVMEMFLYYGKSYQNVMQMRGVGGC